MANISIIAAVARDGTYSINGGLPWDIPEELKHFKGVTSGAAVIMGRKTWDSLPFKPLKGRKNFVVSTTVANIEGATVAPSLYGALSLVGEGKAFVIGGRGLWYEAMELVTSAHITVVEKSFPSTVDHIKVEELLDVPRYWPHLHLVNVKEEVLKERDGTPVPVSFRHFERR